MIGGGLALVGGSMCPLTLNCCCEYKTKGKQQVAKFMPRYDGPYIVTDVHLDASTVTLDMPNAPKLFPTFHTTHVKPWNCQIPFAHASPARTCYRQWSGRIPGRRHHWSQKNGQGLQVFSTLYQLQTWAQQVDCWMWSGGQRCFGFILGQPQGWTPLKCWHNTHPATHDKRLKNYCSNIGAGKIVFS